MKEHQITKQNHDNDGNELEEEAVVRYLQNNPGFFERNQTLVHELDLQHFDNVDNVSSMIEYQVNSLRKRNRELQRRYLVAVKAARINEKALKKLHELALSITAAECPQSFTGFLLNRLKKDFPNIEVAQLFLESQLSKQVLQSNAINELKLVTISHAFFKTRHFYCGPMTEYIAGQLLNSKPVLGSIALLPLRSPAKIFGYLALRGVNQDSFQSEQGGLFLTMLSEQLSEVYLRLLKSE